MIQSRVKGGSNKQDEIGLEENFAASSLSPDVVKKGVRYNYLKTAACCFGSKRLV